MIYACTHVEKEVCVDDPESGCQLKGTCPLSEALNIEAESLAGLIAQLDWRYYINIDNVWMTDPTNVTFFAWDRLETEDGNEPLEHEIERWKAGSQVLYLADWTFWIERREVSNLSALDFDEAGIKHHE